ncbi:MAG TPA: hypothetical protein VF421_02190 [Niabella sp.]
MSAVQLLITLSVVPVTAVTGIYIYRYLNNKLLNAHTWMRILSMGMLLFISIAALFSGGLLLMAWLYDYFS